MVSDPLFDEALRFAADDPDPATAAELRALVAAGARAQLRTHLQPALAFGTAGLRGLLGAGPACMNRSTVARATAGLCQYLLATVPTASTQGLCIGYDARHGSRALAEEAATIALGYDLPVHLFAAAGPTPLLAFAVLELSAAGGVMITASHNPPAYNGYKAYAGNGAQLVEPADREISQRMAAIPSVLALPRVPLSMAAGRLQLLGEPLRSAYLRALAALPRLCPHPTPALRIVYSPLHGVGGALCTAALQDAGFNDIQVVAKQGEPDPDFPTIPFPNPEEAGAMDAALDMGEAIDADLVLANDPDADRLAVAARRASGVLQVLTGNQVGVLLADALLKRREHNARTALLCYSLVTTPMAAEVARAHGARAEVTLTGFKWICNRGLALTEEGLDFVLGFEEALGYAVCPAVRDKDGIAAARLVAQLAADEKSKGRSLWDRLSDLYREHGCHVSGQHALPLATATGTAEVARIMGQLRWQPPDTLAGLRRTGFYDLQHGARYGSSAPLPPADVVILELEGHQRICIRPSGTEPKLKLYFDVRIPLTDGDGPERALASADAMIASLRADLLTLLQQPQGPDDGEPLR